MSAERLLEEQLQGYPVITLDEMKEVRLMNRIDTKFVTTVRQVRHLLELASDDYYVQSVDGRLVARYRTIYYDTNDYRMFYSHQAGRLWRQKIRFRIYEDSNLSFLEVKTKDNHRRTKKKRMMVDSLGIDIEEHRLFAQKHLHYDVATLVPTLENRFKRITLVNKSKTERLTIDLELNIHNLDNNQSAEREQLVIVELKRDGLVASPILPRLRALRIMPHGFSKYCMGLTMTSDSLRINRMKEKLRSVEKLLNKE